jgi:hypothetical protein
MQENRKYNVIFRACDKVNAVNKKPRPFGLTKAQLIKICFLSLLDAMKGREHRITVLGDKLSDEMLTFFRTFNIKLILGEYGNDASIRESLKIASAVHDDEWVYFCEDDYLHLPNAFTLIDNFIKEKNETFRLPIQLNRPLSLLYLFEKNLFIFPPDYPDRYKAKYMKRSLILQSSDCHWREVSNITFTFLAKSSVIKNQLSVLNRASIGAQDKWMSKKLFEKSDFSGGSICFSPMPGLTTHMHIDTMSPLIDWEKITQFYKTKI